MRGAERPMAISKGILNRDHDGDVRWIPCGWDDCQRRGVDIHKTFFHDHNPLYPCSGSGAKHVWYVFCSERHKQYFLHSHVSLGNLPAGSRNVMG